MFAADRHVKSLSSLQIYLLILLGVALWGGSPVAGKLALRQIPPMTIGVLRYGAAALTLVALFGREISTWPELSRREWRYLLGAGLIGIALNQVFFYLGLVSAPATHAAILSPTTSPVWTMYLAARLAGERTTRAQIAGILLCMLGVALVAGADVTSAGMTQAALQGDALLILSGLAWGTYAYFSKIAMERLSALTVLTYAMAIGTAGLLPLAVWEQPWGSVVQAGAETWLSIAYLVVACTLLATFFWNLGIQSVGAGRTAVFGDLTPVFGVMLAWWILGERLTGIQLFGGVLTVSGVWVCQGLAIPGVSWRRMRTRARHALRPVPGR